MPPVLLPHRMDLLLRPRSMSNTWNDTVGSVDKTPDAFMHDMYIPDQEILYASTPFKGPFVGYHFGTL